MTPVVLITSAGRVRDFALLIRADGSLRAQSQPVEAERQRVSLNAGQRKRDRAGLIRSYNTASSASLRVTASPLGATREHTSARRFPRANQGGLSALW